MKILIKKILKEEIINKTVFNDFLEFIEDDPYFVFKSIFENQETTPKEYLKNLIKDINNLSKKTQITLFRVVWVKNIEDIDTNNLGIHWVLNPDDFHEEMLDELFKLSKKINKSLKYNDMKTIEAKFSGKDINQIETIWKQIEHPFEEEITIKQSSKPISIKIYQ